jgi:hypothetical protein
MHPKGCALVQRSLLAPGPLALSHLDPIQQVVQHEPQLLHSPVLRLDNSNVGVLVLGAQYMAGKL